MEQSVPRKILFSVLVIVVVFGLLEGAARLFYRPGDVGLYDEHRQIISVLGLPALNETMKFDPLLFWSLKPDLAAFPVEGRIRETDIDFTVTTNSDGLRSPEIPPKGRRFRVLAVGNSCTFGIGIGDSETWPAALEDEMNRTTGGMVEVINAGVPGYTAFQGKRFLESRGLDFDPDLVIVSFGFNDSDVWSSRSDRETARALQRKEWGALLGKSRFVAGRAGLLRGADIPEGPGWYARYDFP